MSLSSGERSGLELQTQLVSGVDGSQSQMSSETNEFIREWVRIEGRKGPRTESGAHEH